MADAEVMRTISAPLEQLPRTIATARARPYDWVGVLAAEQLEMLLNEAEARGALSRATTRVLHRCLPALERHIEGMCPVDVQRALSGPWTPSSYGFPRTAGYPVVISVLYPTGYPATPVGTPATLDGIIESWPAECGDGSPFAKHWHPIIATTARGNWPAAGLAVTARLARQPGRIRRITEFFAASHDPAEQLVLVVLAAGDAEASVGATFVISLPAFQLRADAFRIRLTGGVL
jgi:hypothetical protein